MMKVCLTVVATAILGALASTASAQSQSWSEVYQGQGRFAVLNQFNGEAVLDRETGLVWQRQPLPDTIGEYAIASRYCVDVTVGNRRGWRLPAIQELESLTDASASNPTLTPGNPFVNVDLVHSYWSSTATLGDSNYVWTLSMVDAKVTRAFACNGATGGCPDPKNPPVVWCVRGGAGAGAQ
jgi:uncharacterized protein DUF1566